MSPSIEFRRRMDSRGRVAIPGAVREAAGLKPGREMLLWAENGEIRISTSAQRMRRAQALVRAYVPEGVSLADELIADRRREAGRSRR